MEQWFHIQDQQVRSQVHRLQLRLATAGGGYAVSSKSASQIGQKIVSGAARLKLSVSDANKAAAAVWKQKAAAASPQLAQAWDHARSASSSLPESGRHGLSPFDTTQGLLTAMLAHQPGDPDHLDRLRLVDVHDRQSVCGSHRPDCIGIWGAMLPSTTGFILDGKTQLYNYFSHENVHQVRDCRTGLGSLMMSGHACNSEANLGWLVVLLYLPHPNYH